MSGDQLFTSLDSQRSLSARSHRRQLDRLTILTPSVQTPDSETSISCPGAVMGRPAQHPVNEHTFRPTIYYDAQEWSSGVRTVRLDTPRRETPGLRQSGFADMEDITSDLKPTLPSRSNGDVRVHRAQDRRQRIDIYGRAFVNERPDEGDTGPNWTCDKTSDEFVVPWVPSTGPKNPDDEGQRLGEDFEVVQYEDDLIESFEEVNRDIPTAFNSKVSR